MQICSLGNINNVFTLKCLIMSHYSKNNESNDTAMKCLCDRWGINRPSERKYEGHAMNIGKGRKSERSVPTGRSPNKVRLSFSWRVSRRARVDVGRERRITFGCPTTFAKFKYPTARLLFVTRRPRAHVLSACQNPRGSSAWVR